MRSFLIFIFAIFFSGTLLVDFTNICSPLKPVYRPNNFPESFNFLNLKEIFEKKKTYKIADEGFSLEIQAEIYRNSKARLVEVKKFEREYFDIKYLLIKSKYSFENSNLIFDLCQFDEKDVYIGYYEWKMEDSCLPIGKIRDQKKLELSIEINLKYIFETSEHSDSVVGSEKVILFSKSLEFWGPEENLMIKQVSISDLVFNDLKVQTNIDSKYIPTEFFGCSYDENNVYIGFKFFNLELTCPSSVHSDQIDDKTSSLKIQFDCIDEKKYIKPLQGDIENSAIITAKDQSKIIIKKIDLRNKGPNEIIFLSKFLKAQQMSSMIKCEIEDKFAYFSHKNPVFCLNDVSFPSLFNSKLDIDKLIFLKNLFRIVVTEIDIQIIHNDINPANICIDEKETPYLINFQRSKLIQEPNKKSFFESKVILKRKTEAPFFNYFVSPDFEYLKSAPNPFYELYSLALVICGLFSSKGFEDVFFRTIFDLNYEKIVFQEKIEEKKQKIAHLISALIPNEFCQFSFPNAEKNSFKSLISKIVALDYSIDVHDLINAIEFCITKQEINKKII